MLRQRLAKIYSDHPLKIDVDVSRELFVSHTKHKLQKLKFLAITTFFIP